MTISDILSHTPLWVWLLLAFVLWRGVAMLNPRAVEPRRALVVPAVFLIWGLTGMLSSRGLGFDLVWFALGGAIGAGLGMALAGFSAPPGLDVERGLLLMPGSFVPLALIVIAFPVKYALAVAIATANGPSQAAYYASLSAAIGGGFAGLFWGRTLTQFRRALSGAGRPSDWGAVAALVGSGSTGPS